MRRRRCAHWKYDPIAVQSAVGGRHNRVTSEMCGQHTSPPYSGETSRLARVNGREQDRACMGADHVTRFVRVDFHSDKRIFGIKMLWGGSEGTYPSLH